MSKLKVIKLSYPHQLNKIDTEETIAAIGFFDGIHKGHQAVIQTAIDKAREQGKLSAVITFYPHPSVVLRSNGEAIKYITPEKPKVELLEAMDVDLLYIVEFSKEFSQLSPEEFVEHYIKSLHIIHLVAGFDFSFGYKGAGDMANILDYADGEFSTSVIEKVMNADEKVSSTKIRQLLQVGNVTEVRKLLTRPFTTKGIVVQGDKRGRTIGFPTANLEITPEALMPKQGVYAVEVEIAGRTYQAMANLGVVPTFKDENVAPTLEVYIFDFNEDIYGEEIKVIWFKYVRDEIKFNGIEALISQLQADEKSIRSYFKQKSESI